MGALSWVLCTSTRGCLGRVARSPFVEWRPQSSPDMVRLPIARIRGTLWWCLDNVEHAWRLQVFALQPCRQPPGRRCSQPRLRSRPRPKPTGSAHQPAWMSRPSMSTWQAMAAHSTAPSAQVLTRPCRHLSRTPCLSGKAQRKNRPILWRRQSPRSLLQGFSSYLCACSLRAKRNLRRIRAATRADLATAAVTRRGSAREALPRLAPARAAVP
jgi:hypothetical protein